MDAYYTFKCTSCFEMFTLNLKEEILVLPCLKCGKVSNNLGENKYYGIGFNNHKYKQSTGIDNGIPFGEVPGDSDYNWIKEGKDFGPLP